MCLLTSFSLSSVTSATRVLPHAASTQHLRDLARLRRVRDRIDREYARPLDVEALARAAHMSAGHLSREFRLAYGESPYSYLMTRRIERAMALLRRGDLSVTEVCFAVGCSSLGTFSSRFTALRLGAAFRFAPRREALGRLAERAGRRDFAADLRGAFRLLVFRFAMTESFGAGLVLCC